MFTIIGSGFGLYGYLPAILRSHSNLVILPEEYKEKITKRTELSSYLDRIIWRTSIEECLNEASGVVIANTPLKQPEITFQVLKHANILQIILEKPLAVDPSHAIYLLDQLIESQVKFRINYSFPYCAWVKKFDDVILREKTTILSLTWTFYAHHFAKKLQTWKRRHPEGGGVLRFYGIHLIALLAKLGYTDVHLSLLKGKSSLEPDQWYATFSSNDLTDFNILLHSATDINRFRLEQICKDNVNTMFDLKDPFELEKSSGNQDVRVEILTKLLDSLNMPDNGFYESYRATNVLWSKAEAAIPLWQNIQ